MIAFRPRRAAVPTVAWPAVVVLLAMVLTACGGCGEPAHPAVGRTVGDLPLLSLADPSRRPPTFVGKVTLLNFWGTWCMPCRRELPGLVRLANRLRSEHGFQLVAVSCGSRGGDDPQKLATVTNAFLAEQRLDLDAWGDPTGRTRLIFAESLGFSAFPTTYLVGPDARIRRVWMGYRDGDETDMARAVFAVLKEAAAPTPPVEGAAPTPPVEAAAPTPAAEAATVTSPQPGSAAAAADR